MPLIPWWFFTLFVLFAAAEIFPRKDLFVEVLESGRAGEIGELNLVFVCVGRVWEGADTGIMLNGSNKAASIPDFPLRACPADGELY